jgi:hypothetical protein
MHGLNPVPFPTLLIPTLHDLLLRCGKGNYNYILGQIHEIHYISDLGEGARTMSSRAMYKFERWYTGSPAAAAPSTPPLSCTLYISLSGRCSRYTSFRITILCIFIDFSSIHHIRILREVKSSCRGICQGNDLDNIFVYCENYTPTQLSGISHETLSLPLDTYHESCQSRRGAGPKSQYSFLCKNPVCAVEGVPVLRRAFKALHPSFDDTTQIFSADNTNNIKTQTLMA